MVQLLYVQLYELGWWPGLYGVVVFAWFMVVSTRRGMLVFAMVLVVV